MLVDSFFFLPLPDPSQETDLIRDFPLLFLADEDLPLFVSLFFLLFPLMFYEKLFFVFS